ncbi:MAG: serine acetyltransferase [Polaribacter sp.]|jgi:serine acetyltransferase
MLSKVFNFLIEDLRIETLYMFVIHCHTEVKWRKYISMYLIQKIQMKFSCYLSPKAKLGKNLIIRHPVGFVIGEGVVLGDNVTIYQNVTFGAARFGESLKGVISKSKR